MLWQAQSAAVADLVPATHIPSRLGACHAHTTYHTHTPHMVASGHSTAHAPHNPTHSSEKKATMRVLIRGLPLRMLRHPWGAGPGRGRFSSPRPG